MFTLEAIRAAHMKVKNGAHFPGYIKELIGLGLLKYTQYVSDGHTEYISVHGEHLASAAKYPTLQVAATGDAAQLKQALQVHQAGETDYLTFCKEAAAAGVEKWAVDTSVMTCTYYDIAGNEMVVEVIPQV